ncbi:MAG: DNA-binding transcriptional regulator [Verrucomicrobia bacterium]|nr:DNA-binding transcriptional regulator [Verrucomicrobiota bacterium]
MPRPHGPTERPEVALLIESSRGYGRGLLRGIAKYLHDHRRWSIFYQERRRGDPPPDWLKDWHGDGVIARVEDLRLLRTITKLGVPAVDVRGRFQLDMPLVETDDQEVTRLAVEHLTSRGFRQFAFCGFPGANYSNKRSRWFAELIRQAGFQVQTYVPPRRLCTAGSYGYEHIGSIYERDIARWIEALPKPIGMMACNDVRGQQVLNACRSLGVPVPDDVAVIGVDNDQLVCDLAEPPLTSVIPNTERIGYTAAEVLERMMAGRPAPAETIYIPPLGVATRRSTDVLAIEDRPIAAAVRYIREHACEGIKVTDLVRAVPMSRRLLERRFTSAVGRTPKAEIVRTQLQRAKDLLAATDFKLAVIAEKTGFKHTEHLCVVFKREVGLTPGAYRRRTRR